MTQALLTLRSVAFSYGDVNVLHDINLDICDQSLIAITGDNGSGKSTFLKIIAGLNTPTNGVLRHIRKNLKISYMPQSNELDRNFPLNVFDVVAMGLWDETKMFQGVKAHEKNRVLDALEKVGLSGFENRHISNLSGGQFQRVLFARIYLENADLILLDEPFSAIDQKTTHDMCVLLSQWHQHDAKTVLCVTHHIQNLKQFFPRIIHVENHQLNEKSTA
jgi:zinc/manganese transport system ATP-binding protein